MSSWRTEWEEKERRQEKDRDERRWEVEKDRTEAEGGEQVWIDREGKNRGWLKVERGKSYLNLSCTTKTGGLVLFFSQRWVGIMLCYDIPILKWLQFHWVTVKGWQTHRSSFKCPLWWHKCHSERVSSAAKGTISALLLRKILFRTINSCLITVHEPLFSLRAVYNLAKWMVGQVIRLSFF